VGIPALKLIINQRLSEGNLGIDRFFDKSAIYSHRWLNKPFFGIEKSKQYETKFTSLGLDLGGLNDFHLICNR
jgi:hypothetical protein